jgi:hypothetical protein
LDDEGQVQFPFKLKGIIFHTLGAIARGEGYHTDKYIYPVGFTSSRVFTDYTNPDQKCRYVSRILDGGDKCPLFEVTCENDAANPFTATSPSTVWANVLKRVNDARGRTGAKNAVSGPEQYGFAIPAVLRLMAALPDAAGKLTKFTVCIGVEG